jgi:hypothetical protein
MLGLQFIVIQKKFKMLHLFLCMCLIFYNYCCWVSVIYVFLYAKKAQLFICVCPFS